MVKAHCRRLNNGLPILHGWGSLMEDFTTIPIRIYKWTIRPQPEFRQNAAAGIIVLTAAALSLAAIIRERFRGS